jgi:2-isopropylmalate synthase
MTSSQSSWSHSPVVLYDTLLRDGSQMEGISFSLDDKVAIAHRLDALGVHYVEGGFPGSNEKDKAFFDRMRERPLRHAKLVAFGGTRKPDSGTATDFNMQALLGAETPVVTLVGKSSVYQVRVALGTSQEENLTMIRESVAFMREHDKEVHFDAEHFFDGFREDADYALQALRTARGAGAEYLVLCDTNGGAMTADVLRAVSAVREAVPDAQLGIHCHDDTGLAVANSLAAVEAGVTQVQGCINGYGERCGNANLTSVIANLQLKMDRPVVTAEQLAELTGASLFVAELANLPLHAQAPYVGASAFAHKAGYHVAAIVKDANTYQHIAPELVGNGRRILVSELSGQRNISVKLAERGLDMPLSKDENRALLDRVKEMESRGFQYEAAEASFELLALRLRADYRPAFRLEDFLIVNRRRHQDGADPTTHSEMQAEAMTKLVVGEEMFQTAGDGNGPVDAMDQSIRRGLTQPYPAIASVHLLDYKVRILDAGTGTGSRVRVLIESSDGEHIWNTVGSSTDVIEASWIALSDAYEYFLYKHPEWSAE